MWLLGPVPAASSNFFAVVIFQTSATPFGFDKENPRHEPQWRGLHLSLPGAPQTA